jgi:hypothetical protein
LATAGLQSERVLWPDKGPSVFEREVAEIEDALLLTTVQKAVVWAQSSSVWTDTFGLVLRDRDDVDRLPRATTSRASGWSGSAPLLGRQTC